LKSKVNRREARFRRDAHSSLAKFVIQTVAREINKPKSKRTRDLKTTRTLLKSLDVMKRLVLYIYIYIYIYIKGLDATSKTNNDEVCRSSNFRGVPLAVLSGKSANDWFHGNLAITTIWVAGQYFHTLDGQCSSTRVYPKDSGLSR
jgi:hypothetical protein